MADSSQAVLGFSGTRSGMTPAQLGMFCRLLGQLNPREVHHGDCTGADYQCHWSVRQQLPGCRIVIHPPQNGKHRAWCEGDAVLEPRPYLVRNDAIRDVSDVVITCPLQVEEQFRGSGTWAMMRHSKQVNKRLWVIWPNGQTTEYLGYIRTGREM